MNFWRSLPRPFSVLAPMEEVTDVVFRQLISSLARPHVFFTEFTSTDGICSPGRDEVSKRLRRHPNETPVVAQLWGRTPDRYRESARLVRELGFDGIDINLGCPVKKVVSKGCCAALIDNPLLVREIYAATLDGAGGLPVSIKTRLGNRTQITEEWAGFLLQEVRPAALTIHARTAREESKVPARWEEIRKVVALRNSLGADTLVIGNGDVFDREQVRTYPREFGVDGVMVGRGVFRDPYIFRSDDGPRFHDLLPQFRLGILREHIQRFELEWRGKKDFAVLKRFFKIYVSGFEGAVALRVALMETRCAQDALQVLDGFQPPGPNAQAACTP